ncbi:MAG: RluA family pseudouridine synthase [Lachnospiraceae bacterium]|nr:RluA family pseudouridine synthase [Lachnospiraceae bacterium]
MQTKIIFEDNSILVIHKPAGLAVETSVVGRMDVVSELKNYLKGHYLGMIHRLDQPVEGLLVFAKTKAAASSLSAQLADHRLKKRYTAIVCVPKDRQREFLELYGAKNGRNLKDYLKKEGPVSVIAKKGEPGAKEARLTAYVTECGDLCEECRCMPATLSVSIETGRFHQIRVQLSHDGYPLLGDQKYGNEMSQMLTKKQGLRNVALACDRLSFFHPETGKEVTYEITPFCGR